MPTVLKRMTLAGNEFSPGEAIPEDVWRSLRERTRRVLVDSRFATFAKLKTPPAATTAPVGSPEPLKRKRGRPPKVRPEE